MGSGGRKNHHEKPPVRATLPTKSIALVVVGVAVVLGAALFLWTSQRRSAVTRDPGLSVLLVTIDTLRADALGSYGNTRADTPRLDRLAREGARFETAHAHNVVTLPSHANILSGRLPLEHGIRDNSGFRFPQNVETLATLLQKRGYKTGAFVSAFPVDSRFGLARGFDVYDDRFGGAGANVAFHMEERPGPETVAAARRWLDAQGREKTFAWIHVYEPHAPYAPPEPFAARFADDPYAGEVAAADAALGPVLEPLLAAGRDGRTLVVVTADHGEARGEHGESTHGIFAYEGTLRVPLILFAPGRVPARIVSDPAQHVDIVPTVLDILGAPIGEGLSGRSLVPAIAGKAAPRPAYFEALSASMNRGWAPLRGVLRNGVKYIDLPVPELYDLARDPNEAANLAASSPQLLDEMRAVLQSFRSSDPGVARAKEDPEVRERLRGLGYISAASTKTKERYTEADDPKTLIHLDNAVNEVIAKYSTGDLAGALQLSRDLVARKPDMPLGLMHLGFLYHQAGDLAQAIACLKRALALNPEDMDVVALLGVYLSEAGRSKEALPLLEPYVRKTDADVEVLVAHGMNLAALGRGDEATASFERVRSIDPSNAMALVNIGTVALMSGQADRAQALFRQALDADPGIARAHNSLGVIAAQAGRYDEAIAEWRRAVELDPGDFQTLFNLGTLLVRVGRAQEARPFFEGYVRAAPPATDRADIERVKAWLTDPSKALK